MNDYKSAKEAFVADNTGTSIWTVNAVSLVGLSSYYLYAVQAQAGSRTSPWVDFLTFILPLLLGQTVFSSRPIAFNVGLFLLSSIVWKVLSRTSEPVLGHDTAIAPDALEIKPKAEVARKSTKKDVLLLPGLLKSRGPQRRRSVSREPEYDTHTIKINSPSPTASYFPDDSSSSSMAPPTPSPTSTSTSTPSAPMTRFPPQPFLSVYRASMMLMTIIAILAVDFPVFPREFGKCEDWGVSLMDIGVGSFVFSLGLTSAAPYLDPNRPPESLRKTVYSGFRKSIPVWILGVVRVFMVKGVEYPEHITEYGMHWNFFFTLGSMPLVGGLMGGVKRNLGVRFRDMGLVVMILHMGSLWAGLQNWVMGPDRTGLIGLNKEGLVSLPGESPFRLIPTPQYQRLTTRAGYIAIYLLGIDIGHYVLPPDPYFAFPEKPYIREEEDDVPDYDSRGVERGKGTRRKEELGMILGSYAVIWWSALWVVWLFGGRVSRRLANPSYVVWTAAFNTTFLAGYLFVELLVFGAENKRQRRVIPPLMAAFNKNGLLLFLAANLLTGLINVSMKTMYASDRVGLTVLGGYLVTLSGLAWVIRHKRFML